MTYPPSPGAPLPPPADPYQSPQQFYGQPGYGQPGPPMVPPPGQSRTVAITMLSIAIGLVILVGGGIVFYLLGQKFSPDPTDASEISISEPDTLNGQPKIEAKELASLTTDLAKELEGYPGAANAFGAVYGSPADKKMIAALAAEVDIDDPQRMLDTVFQSFSGESQLTGVSPASTGSLGGVAQCGSTVIGKEDVAICGWADEGSVGMFLFFAETAVDVKGDFPDMRAEIETKG
ncbi:hypothetical protein OHA21_17330 [Actinoplanes sp. NBC_00393]|uniref:hypothetical protein n=1 Tax=Actinoplanes sp. NBC_00393 TaxID=2975953 RepID=UPI002E22D1C8